MLGRYHPRVWHRSGDPRTQQMVAQWFTHPCVSRHHLNHSSNYCSLALPRHPPISGIHSCAHSPHPPPRPPAPGPPGDRPPGGHRRDRRGAALPPRGQHQGPHRGVRPGPPDRAPAPCGDFTTVILLLPTCADTDTSFSEADVVGPSLCSCSLPQAPASPTLNYELSY